MKKELIDILKKYAYKHGRFTLSSGEESEHYVNCKPVILTGKGLELVSTMMLDHIDTACVAGLTLGADPLVSGVALVGKGAGLIIRKEPKGHGTQSQIEGPLPPIGTTITVLEDVTTTGASAIKAVEVLRNSGYHVNRVVTIVDRQEGAVDAMMEAGLEFRSLVTLEELV
tara:strand:+ start:127 stop:636 length:510 start_codon:yes stop_codon:yes gene_type:complete